MYIILSHPAYNNPKFKLYSNIPAAFRSATFAPQVLTTENTFAMLYQTPAGLRWKGNAAAAKGQIPLCIELGANPLIVEEHAPLYFNPAPPKKVTLSRRQTLKAYDEILEKLAFNKDYESLFTKLAAQVGFSTKQLEVNQKELEQLLELLNIVKVEGAPDLTPVNLDVPPRGVPLIDMSQYEFPLDENGDPILPPEYADIEPAFDESPTNDISTLLPPDSVYHGQSKAEALRLNRTRRRKV